MIDYNIINESNDFYQERGYQRIEAPWTVSPYVDDLTKPKDIPHLQLKHNGKCLVASGEQSFLYLYLKGFLPKGKFQTTTPCFRNELFDDIHTKYFIKTELIRTDDVSEKAVDGLISDAYDFFASYLGEDHLNIIRINDYQRDIVYKNIELGSYGYRSCDYLDWVYGTGVAEPRFSTILDKIKRGAI